MASNFVRPLLGMGHVPYVGASGAVFGLIGLATVARMKGFFCKRSFLHSPKICFMASMLSQSGRGFQCRKREARKKFGVRNAESGMR